MCVRKHCVVLHAYLFWFIDSDDRIDTWFLVGVRCGSRFFKHLGVFEKIKK